MDRLQTVVDGLVIVAIIWGLGSFIKAFIFAFQWLTCNPHM